MYISLISFPTRSHEMSQQFGCGRACVLLGTRHPCMEPTEYVLMARLILPSSKCAIPDSVSPGRCGFDFEYVIVKNAVTITFMSFSSVIIFRWTTQDPINGKSKLVQGIVTEQPLLEPKLPDVHNAIAHNRLRLCVRLDRTCQYKQRYFNTFLII